MSLISAIQKLRPVRTKTQTGPIGVEFALDAINAVQVSKDDNGLELRGIAQIAYPGTRQEALDEPSLMLKLLRELVRGRDFSGRRVVSAIPATELKILQIQYPATKDGSESRVILDMVGDRLDGPLSDYVLDYIPVRHDNQDGQKLALVAVSRRSAVLNLLHTFRKASLQPYAMEIGPVAIRRLVASLTPDESVQNILVVNVGERKTFLTMISGRRLLMDQEVATGQEQLLESVMNELELTREEALAIIYRCGLTVTNDTDEETRDEVQTLGLILTPVVRGIADEIEQAFGYAASVTRGAPSRKIFLSGSMARWPGAASFLAEIAGANVDRFPSPFSAMAKGGIATTDGGDLAVATGLALRGIVDNG